MANYYQHMSPVVIGILFTSIFCLICAIYFILSPKSRSDAIFLSLFLLFEAIWLGLGGIAAIGYGEIYPVLLFKLSLLFYFFAIMSINLYFLTLITPDFFLRKSHLVHAAGPVIAVFLFFFGNDPDNAENFLSLYYYGGGDELLLSSVTSISLFCYFVYMLYGAIKVVREYYNEFPPGWKRIFIFVAANILLSILWMIDKIYSLEYLWHLYLITGCFPIFASFVIIENPEFIHKLKKEFQQKQYVKTRIRNMDVDTTLDQIDNFMRTEKPYRNKNITLKDLAGLLDLSSHQLSELINVYIQKNFYSFINYYRIKEAKEILSAKHNKSILEISVDTGFQSISSFNRAFKKETGESPRNYRKVKVTVS